MIKTTKQKWYCWVHKKADWHEKLREINNRVTSNKMKHVEAEKRPNDHITSYTNLINGPSGEVKLITTKRYTKDLINGIWSSILMKKDLKCI